VQGPREEEESEVFGKRLSVSQGEFPWDTETYLKHLPKKGVEEGGGNKTAIGVRWGRRPRRPRDISRMRR